MSEMLDFVSINMAINNGDVRRRYDDLADYTARIRPDVLMVQEVSINHGLESLYALRHRLGDDYSLRYEAFVYPGQEDEQGLAVITSMPLLDSRATELPSGGNQCQIVRLGTRTHPITAANVHLEAHPRKELFRRRKLGELAIELDTQARDDTQIMAGDFNALPIFPSIRMLKKNRGFTSAYEAVHGCEPAFTFPAMDADELRRGAYLKADELAVLKQAAKWLYMFSRNKPELPHYTSDYILYKNMLRPRIAELIISKSAGGRPISDHSGIRAVFPLSRRRTHASVPHQTVAALSHGSVTSPAV